MDLAGIPLPHLDREAASAARNLLDRCLAHLAEPEDAATAKALEEAESHVRRGPNLRPGEILDRRFLLVEARAPGSLAGRWQGFDLVTRANVAIRVLHPQHLTDPTLWDRFVAGPRAQNQLATADATPPVADAMAFDREWAGFAYAVLDEPGEPLTSRIGHLDRDGRLELLLEIVEATQRMHQAGVAHGALSPDTVLVGPRGDIRLTDVGLYGGAVMGLYVAPESANPSWIATPASDVYLLGLLALTVLRDAPLPYWVVREPEEVLSEVEPSTDPDRVEELRDLLRRMLHWKAELRPSVEEVRVTLLGDLEDQILLARRSLEMGRNHVAVDRFQAVLGERPQDRQLRRSLSEALRAVGRPADAARALAEATLLVGDDEAELAVDLSVLRALAEETGDDRPYVDTLEALAEDESATRDIALLELARFRKDVLADWESVLANHRTRGQAREALENLVRLAEADPRRKVRWGRDLYTYVDDPARGATLAHDLGSTFLEQLGDPDNGLLWLDRALTAGHPDPELPVRVRQLRTARGDWAKTVDLLEQEAERAEGAEKLALLRAASDTARWALGEDEHAAELCARRVELDPKDDDALRHVARRATLEGRRESAARALAAITEPRPEDSCRAIDAWMAAGKPDEALAQVQLGRERWPGHVGILQRALVIALQVGADEMLPVVARELVDRVGPGGASRREALLVLGDTARKDGLLEVSARHYQEVLLDDPLDSSAWWGLVQVAWVAGRTGAEPAWLRAAPKRFPPQEALARLIGGLLDAGAVMAWLLRADGDVSTDGSRLERAGMVVDLLLRHGLVDARLFDDLAALAGEDHQGWVEAVRRLWYGSARTDVAFPVAAAHTWCPTDGPDHFRRTHRVPIGTVQPGPTRPPGALSDADAWGELLVREEDLQFSEEGEAPPPIEPDRRPAIIATNGVAVPVDPLLIVGSGPTAHVELDEDDVDERARFEQRCGRVYVVATEPVEVNGRPSREARLDDGALITIDGHPMRFVADLPPDVAIPTLPADTHEEEDTIPGLKVETSFGLDDPTDVAMDQDPIRAALFFRLDGAERILPLVGERVVIGPEADADLKIGEGTGWHARIEHPTLGIYQIELQGVAGPGGPGQPKLLTQGERFTIADVDFEFQVVEARTPAPAPPRAPPEFRRDDRLPSLFLDDVPGGRTLMITRDTFTIGRGRRNDLQLTADGKLSRHHCTFIVGPLGVRVRDNNSSNGTMVNGDPVDERLLADGDVILIGDTSIVFRWALTKPTAPMLVEDEEPTPADQDEADQEQDQEDLSSDTVIRHRRNTSVSVTDGRTKLQAANEALAVIGAAFDRTGGPGHGRSLLQLALDATPKRFSPLFLGVEARATGLPEMVVLYNLAQRPEQAQRTLLNEALLDLVERCVSQAIDAVSPEEADRLLEDLSQIRYREQLRL
ncbi:MAG: FHA domain-containing protein [Alphaproteobacteria bacterium]|nr:FHA domain-containing protein [Alphaproteobacteria bacterium]